MCDGVCIDPRSDGLNCGACGQACAVGQACQGSVCRRDCPADQVDCMGTCANTRTESRNCGRCGAVCASGTTCVDGACSAACGTGRTACGAASPVHIVESLPFDILILRTDVWVKEGAVDGTVQLMNGDLTVPLSGEFPAAAAGRVTDTGTGSEKPNEAPQNSAIYLKMSADTIEVALCIWAVRMAPPPNP